ncbi:MAG TPA: phosphoenolpyruvate synthase [Gammaproteobacteria bacterium]|nr:phosphoenolpyruvate synthase [Gammaproteobacteria bacterium]
MRYVKRFSELGMDDLPQVGGKNASLGEMTGALADKGIDVPGGFATTADAYRHYLAANGLEGPIREALAALDTTDTRALAETGKRIRGWIVEAAMPDDLTAEIRQAYAEMAEQFGPDPAVAARSSATAEDLPTASFAGQQETYLNVRGADALLAVCKKVYASLYTDRAISYRVHQGFDHMEVALSIGVQKMVRSDLAASGVMFSIDTETGFEDVVFITSAWGLGENVVQGAVNPDEFYVHKPKLAEGKKPILKRQLGSKAIKMVYAEGGEETTRNVDVPREERERFSIDDDEVLELARAAVAIEDHYGRPMDIEWAKDGDNGRLFIVQARPETVRSSVDNRFQETYQLKSRGEVLAEGKAVGQKVADGPARVIEKAANMGELKPGEVLVTDMTDPDWEPVMKVASAIVTNRGGRTCHAAIIARELGIPAVVGTGEATERIADGQAVTVSCAEGDTGYVYEGRQEYTTERIDLERLGETRTKVMLNLANPAQAFEVSRLPAAGVGLARLEFIINHGIRVHPRALLEYDTLDKATRERIDRITAGYADRRDFYVKRLAEGVGMIAASFYPRPVIVRMSDFKSNEYAALIGGAGFEPKEENPMLGFRGAYRYPSEHFRDAFALECAALKEVRETMGLDNVAAMIPFVRTVDEGKAVLAQMAENGLVRGEDGLKVYLMCEIPANALLADQFLEDFDGFSIGSNDLTQLTLGVDRDSGLVQGADERNEAVLALMEMAIAACQRHGKYIGICGQAPSDFPEITRWLVEHRIESISLNPDSVLPMTQVVLEMEGKE